LISTPEFSMVSPRTQSATTSVRANIRSNAITASPKWSSMAIISSADERPSIGHCCASWCAHKGWRPRPLTVRPISMFNLHLAFGAGIIGPAPNAVSHCALSTYFWRWTNRQNPSGKARFVVTQCEPLTYFWRWSNRYNVSSFEIFALSVDCKWSWKLALE
jgi:hypothetical protein